jgi:DNA-binding NarL/FixJ family response regulator
MNSIDVFVVDDHAMFRAGLVGLLATLDGVSVSGQAASGQEAIDAITAAQPDLVLMDIHMPGINGIDATREIVRRSPHVRVVMLTMHEDDDSVFAALRAGALGYVLKGAKQDEIARAIHAAAHGQAIYSPAVARQILSWFARASNDAPADLLPELTPRERDMLTAMAQGKTNQELAAQFFISEKTVRNHVSNIYTKLHVRDRTEAVLRARRAGLT